MTTTEQQPSGVLSAFAGVSCLGALPLGAAVFMVNVRQVAEAWVEGGWPMYAVFAFAALACLANAVGAFLLPRGSVGVAGAGLFLTLLSGAAGVFGFRFVLNGSFAAITHASPADRGVIMHAAVGEALMNVVFAFSMTGALFLMLGFGALVGSAAGKTQRAALAIFGAGSLALGLWQAIVAHLLSSDADAYRAVAHAEPADRMVLLASALASAQNARQFALIMLVPVLICAVAGVMVLRGKPSMGAVTAGLVVPLIALGALRVSTRPSSDELEMMKSSGVALPLRAMKGSPIDLRDRVVVLDDKGLHAPDGESLSAERPVSSWAERGTLSVALARDVKLEQLLALLRQVQLERVQSVRLVGLREMEPPAGMQIPPPFDQQLKQATGVRVLLAGEDVCENLKCEFGSVSGDKLSIGSEILPLVDHSAGYDDGELNFERAIHLKVDGLTLEQLLNAAHTAAGTERRLALHLGGTSNGEQ